MKKLILTNIFLLLFINVFSQKKWHSSFFISPWFTKQYDDFYTYPDSIDVSEAYNKKGLSFITGFDFYRTYDYGFFFKTGIHYGYEPNKGKAASININGDVSYYTYKRQDHYAFLPIMFGYRFNIKKQMFYLSGGMELKYWFYYSGNVDGYGKYSHFNNFIYYMHIKFAFSAAYMYQVNKHFTLFFNPEYVQSKTFDQIDWGDYLIEFRLKFGVILNLNKKN
ncbi:MAG: hypothetical protein L3J74_07635 [Bacteroidales bacterium]|nr:hypothetical protein [Bacteroidales bacterium]